MSLCFYRHETRSFIVLGFTCVSTAHFDLIFVYGTSSNNDLSLSFCFDLVCTWTFNCSNTICLKNYPFSTELPLHLCRQSAVLNRVSFCFVFRSVLWSCLEPPLNHRGRQPCTRSNLVFATCCPALVKPPTPALLTPSVRTAQFSTCPSVPVLKVVTDLSKLLQPHGGPLRSPLPPS